jgi:hypothetical protein
MGKSKITEVMHELSQGGENRKAIARIREIFADIDIAIKAGVKRPAIWAALQKEGYEDIPLRTFLSAVWRIEKEREEKGQIGEVKEILATEKINNGLGYSLNIPKPSTFKRTER